MSVFASSACDIDDTQHYQKSVGPAVRVLGTNIDAVTAEIPVDDVIQISFDRYLLPSTVSRQSFAVADNTNQILPQEGTQTIYDPVARTITIAGPQGPGVAWLTEGLEYKLVLYKAPNSNSDIGGFRAIDRASLDQTYTYVFKGGKAKGAALRSVDAPVNFCADVLPLFVTKCGDSTCHGTPPSPTGGTQPASSLILSTSAGVRVTAVGRVAQGANTSGRSFDPGSPGAVFGIDMPLIDANGNAGSSWLMYKIEMAPHPVVDAGAKSNTVCTPPASSDAVLTPGDPYAARAPVVQAASDSERERLADYVLGRYMPYPSGSLDYTTQPLTFEERERVRRWIAQGAPTPECGGCGVPTVRDAGTTSTPDAGSDAGDGG